MEQPYCGDVKKEDVASSMGVSAVSQMAGVGSKNHETFGNLLLAFSVATRELSHLEICSVITSWDFPRHRQNMNQVAQENHK